MPSNSYTTPSNWMFEDGNGEVQEDDIVKEQAGWTKIHPNGQKEVLVCMKGLAVSSLAAIISTFTNPANGSYTDTQSMSWTIVFDKAVTPETGATAPRLVLDIDGVTDYADCVTSVPGTSLTFTFTAGTDTGALTLPSLEIDLNGGALLDANSVPANNDFPSTFTQPAITIAAA